MSDTIHLPLTIKTIFFNVDHMDIFNNVSVRHLNIEIYENNTHYLLYITDRILLEMSLNELKMRIAHLFDNI